MDPSRYGSSARPIGLDPLNAGETLPVVAAERERPPLVIHHDPIAHPELAGEHPGRRRVFDLLLDHALERAHGPRALNLAGPACETATRSAPLR